MNSISYNTLTLNYIAILLKNMKKEFISLLLVLSIPFNLYLLTSCGSSDSKKQNQKEIKVEYVQQSPSFNEDSAFYFVQRQVDFGSRVPGTAEHRACGDFLSAKLESFGAEVIEQKTEIKHYNGRKIPIRNIIGSFSPEKEKRVLLFAHWDSRPFADEETDPEIREKPILGADDGASGIGVLLEVARQLQMQESKIGVDIIFFDLEDWGPPSYLIPYPDGDWWCMGSRYWSENPHVSNYKASFGILLDMVGAFDAKFLREGHSVYFAPDILQKVWRKASELGYDNFFKNKMGGYITDDHVPVNENVHVPSIDIINQNSNTSTGFGPYWHTHKDDMRNISKATLRAVGQTVLEVIYCEE